VRLTSIPPDTFAQFAPGAKLSHPVFTTPTDCRYVREEDLDDPDNDERR